MRRDFPERIKMSLRDTLVESFFLWLISYIPTFSTSFNPVLNKRVDPSRQPRDVICGMLRCLPSMHASDGAPTGSRHRREGNALLMRSLHDVTAHRKQQPSPSSRCLWRVDASTSVRFSLSTSAVARFAPRSASIARDLHDSRASRNWNFTLESSQSLGIAIQKSAFYGTSQVSENLYASVGR